MQATTTSAGRNLRTRSTTAILLTLATTIIVIASLILPIYVIRPFRHQDPQALTLALFVTRISPWLSAICAIIALLLVIKAWKTARWPGRITLGLLLTLTITAAALTHLNVYEIKFFHPYPSPSFEPASAALSSKEIDADDKVLAVTIDGQSHAFPIRNIAYHHVINDTLAGQPIAATYCTLCHTGFAWSRVLDGRTLHLHLAGINNGNALLRDEETGSVWQQSTGQAIFGPLKGRQLALVHSSELTFALWRSEQPDGLILKPNSTYVSEYETKDWEQHIEKTRVVVDTTSSGIAPHQLMLGITLANRNKAYPVTSILTTKLIQDRINGEPILILVGPDQTSIRVFHAQLAGDPTPLTFVRNPATTNSSADPIMTDLQSGSTWSFKGCATSGASSGKCLSEIDANKDYWFDWLNHHPSTTVYRN